MDGPAPTSKREATTLTEPLEWNNSTIAKGGVAQEKVSRLKQQHGGDILVGGSAKLANTPKPSRL